jgi:4-hydroxythreonine-4-phosphate dehydrogenase
MLAERAGNVPVAMMMAAERTAIGGPLRVVLATTHLPLAGVPEAVTTPLLLEQTLLTHLALRASWLIDEPRIALCALNPHASDGGLFGDEEERVMRPAIEALRAQGVRISGPIPADTVFVRAARGEFDAVIAPYHDVGMAAFKTAAFGHGVNVTLGLPFVRTSPDHGTAIDIAGTGAADSSSMAEAIRLAIMLATRKAATVKR